MTDTLKSVVEEELQKAYERGVQDGMKQEHAMWVLAKIGQEIEAQPEPVAWATPKDLEQDGYGHVFLVSSSPSGQIDMIPLYTAPQKKEWVGLTDEEVREFEIWLDDEEEKHGWNPPADIVKYLEAKLKEKNETT